MFTMHKEQIIFFSFSFFLQIITNQPRIFGYRLFQIALAYKNIKSLHKPSSASIIQWLRALERYYARGIGIYLFIFLSASVTPVRQAGQISKRQYISVLAISH